MTYIDREFIADILKEYINLLPSSEIKHTSEFIEFPNIDIPFDYAFPCFRLSKYLKKSPNQIAIDIVNEIKNLIDINIIEEVKASGPYVNFLLKPKSVLEPIFELKEKFMKLYYLKSQDYKKQRIVIEYPSPNTNKPLHLGHVRNMLLGKFLVNLFKYVKHDVFQVNLNNDRGIHICKSMVAYKKWGNNKKPNIKTDHFVGQFYVRFNKELEKYDKLLEEASKTLKLWEENDSETRELWEKMNKWAFDGFNETYQKFKITFEKEYYESELYKEGKDIILENVNKGILDKTEDGAIIAHLKDYGVPDKILLRKDGTSIYITQDINLALIKKNDFNYDKSIYIVGNEQDNYFRQLFAVLEMIGFKEDKYHFSYGMISLPEGKMKSREGTTVDADDLVEEMSDLAYEEVSKRYQNLSEDEKLRRAGIIGMAALRFFILKFAPKTNFIFNPKESLSFEGETGPYIQYCFARIESIISKSNEKIDSDINYERLNHEAEGRLIKKLNVFPYVFNFAMGKNYFLHLIPQNILHLCQIFNSFYANCQVISNDKELERARLFLIKCVQIVIKTGLNLLGIETLDEM